MEAQTRAIPRPQWSTRSIKQPSSNVAPSPTAVYSDEQKHFFALSNDLFCVITDDLRFTMLNPAWERILGYTSSELLSLPMDVLAHPDDVATLMHAQAYFTCGHQHISFENRFRCRDGSYRWFSWNMTRDGANRRLYGVARDITTRKMAEQELERVAIVEERNRLARDLHDSVTQAVFSLGLMAEASRLEAVERGHVEAVADLAQIGEIAQQALKEMRLLIYQLRSPMLDNGLVHAVRQRLETVERRAGIAVQLHVPQPIELQAHMEETLYRVIQEALNNVVKHAQATSVSVRFLKINTGLQIEIEDNGVGFDGANIQSGIGLSSMRERVAQFGGSLDMCSTLGVGTTVRVHVPLA